jgi:hypothetical protein
MKILILLSTLLSLISCSSTNNDGMTFTNMTPRGISILNIRKEERSKAYQSAERHCAKYYKVPRILKTIDQQFEDELHTPMRTTNFECVKPSN